jgi:hypothetical protein
MKKHLFLPNFSIFFFLILFFFGFNVLLPKKSFSQNNNKQLTAQEIEDYFVEIALGSEFGKGKKIIRKWRRNIKYMVASVGVVNAELTTELTKMVRELNILIGGKPQITEVYDRAEANFVIFFGKASNYVNIYEPKAENLAKTNWGLFYVSPDKDGFMIRGTMYVDTERIKLMKEQKHILREEFTQALGLMNDSFKYPNSIFQQKWTDVNEFSPIDRELIKILYHPRIKAGMNETRVRSIIKQILAP